MARVDEVRPWNLPIAFLVPKGRKPTLGDIIDWNKQNPNPIQKLTYLTLGGIIATIFGTAVSIRRENLLGAIIAILGIGTTVSGIICAPDTNEESKSEEETKPKEEAVTPPTGPGTIPETS